jgi:hypothetical protein
VISFPNKSEENKEKSSAKIPEYKDLEEWLRLKIQKFIQELLIAEVEVFLGRK